MPERTPVSTPALETVSLKQSLLEQAQLLGRERDRLQRELEAVTVRLDDTYAAIEGIEQHRRSQP